MISFLFPASSSGLPQALAGFGVPRQQFSRGVGLVLAVALHVVLLWLILAREPMVLKPPSTDSEGAITYIAPLAEAAHARPITPPPSKPRPVVQPLEKPLRKPTPVPKKAKSTPPPPAPSRARQLATTPPLTPAPTVAPAPEAAPAPAPPAEDFSARLEANRKKRAEEQAQNPALAQAPSETEDQRANRIARENIASQQPGQATERDKTGGVFQLRSVRAHSAEFMFRGWNTNFRRNWSQLVEVEQGSEADIENAVVKRMIDLIRTHKTGEFIWDSHRLGRQITLNAEPAYEGALRAFLLKEFFPTYVKSSGRG